MRFDTVTFWAFFAVAWALWRLLPFRAAKGSALLASLVFYAWWRPEYLLLILASTLVDYRAGLGIAGSARRRTRNGWLLLSLCTNLGLLGVFKYTPLVARTALALMGHERGPEPAWLADWVIPVGISFYTFQTLSYTIDVHARRLAPARSFLDFFLYVSFFPQLVAGPIVRARTFLPQLGARRPLSWLRVQTGLYECVLGLFLKVVVADQLGPNVDRAFNPAHVGTLAPTEAWLGAIQFGAQIFADFAGYSGIAIGLAHLLGLTFPENFRAPYMSRSLSEFWTRWHITLSSWLRDYLYVPLGGNRKGRGRTYVNLMLTMLLGGLWHGASWTFLAWGGLHGAGLAVERALGVERGRSGGVDPLRGARDLAVRLARVALVFLVVHVAWVFFRAPDFDLAWLFLERMFVAPFEEPLGLHRLDLSVNPQLVLLLPVLALHVSQMLREWRGVVPAAVVRLAVCALCLFLLLVIERPSSSPFLYFQF
jgi:alginate O-acetyltransferase complex protein AlgI